MFLKMLLVLGTIFIFGQLIRNSYAFGYDNLAKNCDWLKNDTVASAIRGKKSSIVERCLFYKLLDDEMARTGLKNGLSFVQPEPSPSGNDKVTVYVHGSKLTDFKGPTNFRTSSEFSGVIYVSWLDNRLKWDRNAWKIQHFKIKGSEDIWLPENSHHGFYASSYLDEKSGETNVLNITVSSMGNVTAEIEFTTNAICQANEFNYPMETLYCCSTISSQSLNAIREYQIDDYTNRQQGHQERMLKQLTWHVNSFYVSTEEATQLRACLSARRSRALLKTELLLPMVASTVFLLASPFFGSMTIQAYVKMFAILLQVLCFQFVIERQAMTWFTQVPRIFRFYEVTFGTTLASLIVTLIIGGLTKIKQTLPPPRVAQIFAEKVNVILFFCQNSKSSTGDTPCRPPDSGQQNSNQGATTGEGQQKRAASSNGSMAAASMQNGSSSTATITVQLAETETERKFNREWIDVFVALNNLASLVILLLYCIVLLITCV